MSATITVQEILKGFPNEVIQLLREEDLTSQITSVTSDSRDVKPGSLFVAVRGATQDGHQFIPQALKQGAALIIGEKPHPVDGSVPYVQVADVRKALAQLGANFYGNPSQKMIVVGVTGTSGKTTTTYLVESILKAADFEVGVIGTINFRYKGKVMPSTHTTPGAVELQRMLAEMKAAGCNAVVMEVSSHALKQNRTANIAFDAVVFTNLSREHLDFHPDMDDYFNSKALLFTDSVDYSIRSGKRPFAAINGDDEYGQKLSGLLLANPKPELWFAVYGMSPNLDISGSELKTDMSGIRGEAAGVQMQSSLTGLFNAYNLLSAIAVAQGLGIDAITTARGVSNVTTIPGRLERVPNTKGIHVLVDYAHKPDALEKVLKIFQDMRKEGKLITVFGCGGDRDRTKRPVMGKLAVELSDRVFVTSDNPRTEDPAAIIQEILGGIRGHSNYVVEPDRKRAISAAVHEAQPGDLVLIAGKGHEDYQILGTEKIHFDDREVASEALAKA